MLDPVSGQSVHAINTSIEHLRHLKNKTSSQARLWYTQMILVTQGAAILTGSFVEGSSLAKVQFIRRKSKVNSGDIDVMIPVFQLCGRWERLFISGIPNRPGFVQINATKISGADKQILESALVTKLGRKFISASKARRAASRKASSFNKVMGIAPIDLMAAKEEGSGKAAKRYQVFVEDINKISDRISKDNADDFLSKTTNDMLRGTPEDVVPAIFCEQWPKSADCWVRRSLGKLDHRLVYDIVSQGYQLVAKCDPDVGDPELDWRMSFSIAETLLIHNFSHKQWLCFCFGKLYLHEYLEDSEDDDTIVTSYHYKTAMLWACESKSQKHWQERGLGECILGVFDELLHAIVCQDLPHYFLQDVNLFALSENPKKREAQKNALMDAAKRLSSLRINAVACFSDIQTAEPYLETLDQMQRTILDMMTFCCQHAEPMDNFSKVLSGSPAVAAMSMIMQYCTNKLPFSSVLTGECLLNAYLSVTQHALNTLSSQLHTDIANHTKGMSISMDDGEDQAGILDGILMKVYYQFFKESYQFGVNLVNEVRKIRQQKGKETDYFIGKLINKDAHYFTKPIPTHSKRWKMAQILQADTALLATPETPEYISRQAKDMRVFKRCWEELAEPFVLTTLLENLKFLEDYAYSQEMIRSQRNLSDLSYIIEYKLNPDQRQYLLVSFLIRRLLKAYAQN